MTRVSNTVRTPYHDPPRGCNAGVYTAGRMRVFLPAAAVAVCGFALYFTRSVLDIVVVGGEPVRVALLPGWPVLAAFLAMATLGVLWLTRRSMPRTVTSAPIRLRVGMMTLPLFALATLILPYLPFVPDAVRPLLITAGPLKWVIWLAIGGLFFWTLWQGRIVRADWLGRLTVDQAAGLIGVATALAVRAASAFGPLDGRDYIALMAAAVAAALMWRFLVERTNAPGAATFAWAAVALTAPFVFNARVDRHMVAALALVIVFTMVPIGTTMMLRLARWGALAAPVLVMAWLGMRDAADPPPNAAHLAVGVPGLLFDQQYGLLANAPVYILAATGLVAMIRAGDDLRRRAIEIAGVFVALLVAGGMLSVWWAGTASPARPLSLSLLLLAFPIAVTARAAAAGSASRASHQLLLCVSIGVAITLAIVRDRFVGTYERDGASRLLEYWSSGWPAWTAAPSFTVDPLSAAWMRSGVWLAVAIAAAFLLRRVGPRTAGGATLAASATFAAALLIASGIASQIETTHLVPVNLNARASLTLLDGFDADTRPMAIKYDPFELLPANAIVPLASLSVAPGTRGDNQPIRVLHNGRFSLPAGQYHLDVEWATDAPNVMPLGLQVGLLEPAWQTWQVQPQRGAHWTADINLPVDAPFLALRGATDLERAVALVSIQPTNVLDAGDRPRVPAIQTASQIGSTMVLYHDDRASMEPMGFWVIGGSTARVTFARDAHDTPLVLRIHSGLKPNRVLVSSRGWQETMYLNARTPQDITLPDSERRVVTVDIRAEDGFRPRDFDPASPDPRFLGAWVQPVASGQ